LEFSGPLPLSGEAGVGFALVEKEKNEKNPPK
jgi:hypothetical protein